MSAQLGASSSGEELKPEWISIQRAAILLEVHENTVYNWIRTGEIVAIRCGPRLIRIPRSEIVRLRAARTIRPITPQ